MDIKDCFNNIKNLTDPKLLNGHVYWLHNAVAVFHTIFMLQFVILDTKIISMQNLCVKFPGWHEQGHMLKRKWTEFQMGI